MSRRRRGPDRQSDETEGAICIRGYVMSRRRRSPDRQSDETQGAMDKRVRDVTSPNRETKLKGIWIREYVMSQVQTDRAMKMKERWLRGYVMSKRQQSPE